MTTTEMSDATTTGNPECAHNTCSIRLHYVCYTCQAYIPSDCSVVGVNSIEVVVGGSVSTGKGERGKQCYV